MPDSSDDAVVHAAGAVVWRPGAKGLEVALIHRPKYDDWSYPKGKCEPGEHVLVTATREVVEETGLRVILGRPLSTSTYQAGPGTKRVSYWAARCVHSVGFVPGGEVDQVAWLSATAARDRLGSQRDIALLDEFLAARAMSVPFILLRHAEAGRKSRSRSGDLARPLDVRGSADAKLLAALLSCYGPCRVVSSAAERCLGTVRPYAAAIGVPVEAERAFTLPADDPAAFTGPAASIGSAASMGPAASTDPAAGRRRAAGLAAAGEPVLICAHRENLPVLLEAACRTLGAEPPHGAPLAKSAFWVLQSAGGVLISAEQHRLVE